MQQNIFDFIEGSYNTFKELIPELLESRKTLDKDFINEYMHLLTNINFDFENLYSHDIEQPGDDTLQKDFYNTMSSTLKLINYLIMIKYDIESNKIMNNFYYLVSDIKTQYYNYIDNGIFEEAV